MSKSGLDPVWWTQGQAACAPGVSRFSYSTGLIIPMAEWRLRRL